MCYKPRVVFTCCGLPPSDQLSIVEGTFPVTKLCMHFGKPSHEGIYVTDELSVTFPLKCQKCSRKFHDDWDACIKKTYEGIEKEYAAYADVRDLINNVIQTVSMRLNTLKAQFHAERDLVNHAWWRDIRRLGLDVPPNERLERPRPWRLDYDNYIREYKILADEYVSVVLHSLEPEPEDREA